MAISATSATGPAAVDWFDTNFRQVLGVAGAPSAARALSAPQMLAALGKRYVRNLDRSTRRVTFIRNGEALQLMEDPAEVDPLIATFAASQLGGPRSALATIEADRCVAGDCEGDAGRALATIRATLDTLIEASSRRNGWLRSQLLISQLIGISPGATPDSGEEFGLLHRLRRRVAEGNSLSPSFAREQALDVLDLAIEAVGSFGTGMCERVTRRSRPLHDVVETLHSCAVHISERVIEVRETLVELGIGQCELDRAGRDGDLLPKVDNVAVPIPDLLWALETQPREWIRVIDGAAPGGQAAIAASARNLKGLLGAIDPDRFAGLFNLADEPKRQLGEVWKRFTAYTNAVLGDLQGSLVGAPAPAPAAAPGVEEVAAPAAAEAAAPEAAEAVAPDAQEALIDAPEEEKKPL